MVKVPTPVPAEPSCVRLRLKKTTRRAASIVCGLFLICACNQVNDTKQPDAPAEAPVNATPVTLTSARPDTSVTDTTATDSTAQAGVPADSGWNYPGPKPLPGAVLPQKRIVAYYGNLLSKRMGILGELPPDEMLRRLDGEVAGWEKADPATPVQPALHAIVVTAQGQPGRGSKYRLRMTDKMIHDVLEIAEKRDAIVFLDVQVGHSTLQEELPRLAPFLQLPNVHLGIDAEFSMKDGSVPGKRIGSFNADDINYATGFLAKLVTEHNVPPKILVVHRFTQGMIKNASNIKLDERVQVVMHMDGWGPPALKKNTYRTYIAKEPVQFTGFKIFYKNDTKNGSRLVTKEEILALKPKPLYIQYQ